MLAALAPSHPSFRRVRSLNGNKLGPEGGMALAEALKSNTTLEYLMSAALPRTHSPMPCGCILSLTPARRRLRWNNLGDDAKQALRAAARSGLELDL